MSIKIQNKLKYIVGDREFDSMSLAQEYELGEILSSRGPSTEIPAFLICNAEAVIAILKQKERKP
jgi:hypothetical protein